MKIIITSMETLVPTLQKRHRYGFVALAIAAIVLVLLARFYPLMPPSWIPSEYRKAVVVILYCYKMVELTVFCYLLLHRPLMQWHRNQIPRATLHKRTKTFYFLAPQGSIVFALIAYKVSGSPLMGWGLLLIGAVTLLQCRPSTLLKP